MSSGLGSFLKQYRQQQRIPWLPSKSCQHSMRTMSADFLLPQEKNDNVRRVFDYIEQYPIIEIKRTAADLGVSYNTVSSAVDKLVQTGILKETTNASRNRVFSYEEYLNILRKDT